MKIISIKARDILRLTAVEITPAGDVVVLGGDNAQGKSSVLDAIVLALKGKRFTPDEPIHRGAKRGYVALDLGDLQVLRVVTAKSDRLVVRSPDGAIHPRPQEILNKLFNSISFDPLRFAAEPPDKQAETLRQLAGLDFAMLDAERVALYVQRTEVGRDCKRMEARVHGMPSHAEAPVDEVSVAGLAAQLKLRQEQQRQADKLKRNVKDGIGAVERMIKQTTEAAHHIADLERDLETARRDLETLKADVERAKEAARTAKRTADEFVVEDPGEIESQLATAEELNRAVRENAQRAHAEAEAEALSASVRVLTDEIDQIDQRKLAMLSAANFPVPGLALSPDGGVFFNGIPFAQSSTAEKIRVSLAIGIAMNPDLRVLFVRDGSLLDRKGLQLVAEMAAEHDCQIWLEDARTQDPTAIIIEDGRVQGAEPEADDLDLGENPDDKPAEPPRPALTLVGGDA